MMQNLSLTSKELIQTLSASLNLDETGKAVLKSEIENLWKTLNSYKEKHDSLNVELKSSQHELDSTRATSLERKNNLKLAQEKIAHNNTTIESLREMLDAREAEQTELLRKLSKLEGQLEILTQLVMRA